MLAAAAAPAFVRSDSLMKLWVPRQETITFPPPSGAWGRLLNSPMPAHGSRILFTGQILAELDESLFVHFPPGALSLEHN